MGVKPICGQLPIAPSTYYEHKAWRTDPEWPRNGYGSYTTNRTIARYFEGLDLLKGILIAAI